MLSMASQFVIILLIFVNRDISITSRNINKIFQLFIMRYKKHKYRQFYVEEVAYILSRPSKVTHLHLYLLTLLYVQSSQIIQSPNY